jgi:poly(beta-D-mannuronate) lyase
MDASGRREVAWGTDDGETHELSLRVAVTHVPKTKPHVVCTQIHDGKGDVLMIRVEGRKVLVERKPEPDLLLSREYELGKPLDVVLRAAEGRIRLWHDGELKMDWKAARSGCYFKAGCYVQSNPSKGDAADDYGEVIIERLSVR